MWLAGSSIKSSNNRTTISNDGDVEAELFCESSWMSERNVDLAAEAGDVGSGHMDTTYTSSVFSCFMQISKSTFIELGVLQEPTPCQ